MKGGYVDGFLLVVRPGMVNEYKKMAKLAGKVWHDHGALEYRECIGEDVNIKMGTPFPKVVKAKRGETIVFSWIRYKNRKHRDAVNAKVMQDPRLADMMKSVKMPFEMKRMSYGGFEVLVEA